MLKYYLEFILNAKDITPEVLEDSFTQLGEGLEVSRILEEDSEPGENFKIHIHTQDPTLVFDTCSQFGRIKSVKIDEKHS
jgi:dihydroxyacetone kinase-like predicted kinase